MGISKLYVALGHACIVLKHKQAEVVNENGENINQMKSMLLARVRKRAPSWGSLLSIIDQQVILFRKCFMLLMIKRMIY